MTTTLKAILDAMGTAIADAPGSTWTRLVDTVDPKWQALGFRLLVSDFERDPEFGVDAAETLAGEVAVEFYRGLQTADDASFFADLSAIAKTIEAASYPSGTIAVIVRTRRVERNFTVRDQITGTLSVTVKWEQAY